MIGSIAFSQSIKYENLKNFIGNRIFEFEDFYNIQSDKIEDNFGNLTVYYNQKNIDDSVFDIILKTEEKNIIEITVINKIDRTKFFKNAGIDLENSVKSKKNYKTVYISLNKLSNKKKTFYETTEELIEKLKTTDLNEFNGLLESEQLNSSLLINNNETILLIK